MHDDDGLDGEASTADDDGVEGRFNRRVFQQVPRIPVCSFSEKRRGRPRIFRFLIFRQFFPMAGK